MTVIKSLGLNENLPKILGSNADASKKLFEEAKSDSVVNNKSIFEDLLKSAIMGGGSASLNVENDDTNSVADLLKAAIMGGGSASLNVENDDTNSVADLLKGAIMGPGCASLIAENDFNSKENILDFFNAMLGFYKPIE